MRLTRKLWLIFSLFVLTSSAMADSVTYQTISGAAQRSNDLSRQMMVMIFGDVVIHPFTTSEPTLIGSLFGILNGVLAACAMFWFLAITLKGLVKSGHQGQFFGNGRSPSYIVMTLMGFMMIIPMPSGWSMSQLLMLWATSTMGVGSANLLTDKAVDMMNSGYSMVTQPTAASTRTAARGMFEMSLCKYATNSELKKLYQDGAARTQMMTMRGSNGHYMIGNGSAVCGRVDLPEPSSSALTALINSNANTASVVTAQKQALDVMGTALDKAAYDFVETYLNRRDKDTGTFADVETQIQNAAAGYESKVSQAINKLDYKDSLQGQLTSQLKSDGWIALGSWYLTFATANGKTNDVAKTVPVISGRSFSGETGTGDLLNQVMAAYLSQVQNSSYTAPLGTQTAKDDGAAASATDPNAALIGFFSKPMQTITNQIATWNIGSSNDSSNQVNPLIKMQNIGDTTLNATLLSVTAFAGTYAIASAASNSPIGMASRLMAVDTGAVVKDTMGALEPVFYFMVTALMAIGFTLAVYLPAVPFIFWMTGVTNYAVSILVGIAAGSMWAATHLGAEEDKGSRSAYGYIFLIDMMLRPSLMVLGFFFASVATIAAGTILNTLFASALASANADSFVGIIKMVGWLMIYARISTYAVTRLFGLQATLADYVISFLGGRDGANLMGGMVDNVKGMFGAVTSQAQRAPGINSTSRNPGSDNTGKDGIQ